MRVKTHLPLGQKVSVTQSDNTTATAELRLIKTSFLNVVNAIKMSYSTRQTSSHHAVCASVDPNAVSNFYTSLKTADKVMGVFVAPGEDRAQSIKDT